MLSLFRGSFILDGMYLTVVITSFSLSSSLVVALLVAKITGGVVIVVDSSFPFVVVNVDVVVVVVVWSSSSSGSLLCGSVRSTDSSLLTLLLVVLVDVMSVLGVSLVVKSLLVVSMLCDVEEAFVEWEGVVEVVEHWHVGEVSVDVDLRIDRLLSASVGELDVEVEEVEVAGVSVSRIEESVFVQSDSVMEHPGDSGAVELSWDFFNLDPQSLHTPLPSTKAT